MPASKVPGPGAPSRAALGDTGAVTSTRRDAADRSVPPVLACSARGCRAAAGWGLRWNNPRLHTPERRKTWLACDEHRITLGEFLAVRGFLRETLPVAELAHTDTR